MKPTRLVATRLVATRLTAVRLMLAVAIGLAIGLTSYFTQPTGVTVSARGIISLGTSQSNSQTWYSSDWTYRKQITLTGRTWLSGWTYRKQLAITGTTAGAQTNYQIKITVHYGSGTDTSTDIYCSNHCNTDFSDIRWTTSDSSVVLDYWIESSTSSNNAIFWIEFDSIPASPSTATFYVYYGNAGASSASNGSNTFNLFDDFSGDLSLWNVTGSVSIVSGICQITGADSAIDSKTQFGLGYSVRALSKSVTTGDYSMDVEWRNQPETVYTRFINYSGASSTYESANDQVGFTVTDVLQSTDYKVREISRITSIYNKFYVGSTLKATRFSNETSADRAGSRAAGKDVYVDWILVREIVSPEPTWTSWGAEEGGVPSLSNTPSGIDLGQADENSTYYAKGHAPSNPVTDDNCTLTITNDGTIAIDVAISSTNFTGGGGWALISGSPGSGTVRMTAYYSGENVTSGVILTNSNQSFYSNLLASGTKKWDFELETGTFPDSDNKSATITLTATAHS